MEEFKLVITQEEYLILAELKGYLSETNSKYIKEYTDTIDSICKKYREKHNERYDLNHTRSS